MKTEIQNTTTIPTNIWYAAGRIEVPNDHKERVFRFGLVENIWDGEIITEHHIPDVCRSIRYSGPYVSNAYGHLMDYFGDAGNKRNGWHDQKDNGSFSGTASHGDAYNDRNRVFQRSLEGIRAADCVFAWIEDEQCFGTLYELGYANALGKKIFIAHPPTVSLTGELWFAFQHGIIGEFPDAETAWVSAIRRNFSESQFASWLKGGAA